MVVGKKGILLLLIILLMIALVLPSVSANSLDEKQRELDEVSQGLKEGKNDLKAFQDRIEGLESEIQSLKNSIGRIQRELQALSIEVSTTEAEIEITELELADAEARLKEREDFLHIRIRAIYELGSVNYLEVIMDSSSFSEFLTRFNHLQLIVDRDSLLLEEVQEERAEIAQQKEELEEKRENLLTMRRQSLVKKDQVEKQKREQDILLAELQAEYKEQESNIREMEKEAKEIERVIKQLEEAQRQAARGGSVGQLLWPVANGAGTLTSPFGPRVLFGVRGFHRGIDIATSAGTPIVAAEAGVAYPYRGGSYGNYIIIIHGGGMATLYAHNQRNLVGYGQTVSRGDVIAYMGSTGFSFGPHVHFEVRVNGQFRDPMEYLR